MCRTFGNAGSMYWFVGGAPSNKVLNCSPSRRSKVRMRCDDAPTPSGHVQDVGNHSAKDCFAYSASGRIQCVNEQERRLCARPVFEDLVQTMFKTQGNAQAVERFDEQAVHR